MRQPLLLGIDNNWQMAEQQGMFCDEEG